MLEHLEVHGLGIIDTVVLEPADGLVALTGETGAGKSLLVESLKLLSGERAQADMVRTGEPKLRVQGIFAVPESSPLPGLLEQLGVESEGSVTLRREVTSAGRSRAWINDVAVTAATLQQVAPHLVAIHGQHDQYGLADSVIQRRLVDEFAGHKHPEKVRGCFERWQEAAAELERLRSAQARRRDRLDTITFQLAEIDNLAPSADEDVVLAQRCQVLRHAVRLRELAESVLERLAEGETATLDQLARAEREVAEMATCGLALDPTVQRLAEARVNVEEVVREVQDLSTGVGEEPGELESVESRLHSLDQLMLKYGSPISEVLEYRRGLEQERAELEAVESRIEAAAGAAEKALRAYDRAAVQLHRSRCRSAAKLVAGVSQVLGRLNMAGTRLEFSWQARPDPASPLLRDGTPVVFDGDGVEECQLLIAANPGEEPRPMARIASGGELSRLHLALRTVLRDGHQGVGMTLLFDEVDTGLGGGTASALAVLLADLAKVDQVMVVTHLPQVAARAASQLRIAKISAGSRVVTKVVALAAEDRVEEVARMLAGAEVGSSALAHAAALLEAQ